MKKSIRRLVKPRLFAMSISLLAFSSITYGESNGSFALSEHWSMGQQIKLRFDINEVPQSGVVLHLKMDWH